MTSASSATFLAAMMVLTNALGLLEAKSDDNKTAKHDLVKRWTYCSPGWTGFNGRCFRYIPRAMTWAKAEKNCRSMGGTLASVRDIDDYHEIQRLITTISHDYAETWIGGSDAEQEGHWLWSDGTPFHFTNWCPGEPNNSREWQHCMQMNYGAQKCWDDDVCYYQKPSVCSKISRLVLD